MIRSLTLALTLLALGCSCGDRASIVFPDLELPVVGTAGDLPPPRETLVVEWDPEWGFRLQGAPVSFDELERTLLARARSTRAPEDPSGCNPGLVPVVLRLDRGTPWGVADLVRRACGRPDVRIHRVFFAVEAEDGSGEGALALFLVKDRGLSFCSLGRRRPLYVSVEAGDPAAGPEDLFAAIRGLYRSDPPAAVLTVDPRVPVGRVLGVADAALRAGSPALVVRIRSGDGLRREDGASGYRVRLEGDVLVPRNAARMPPVNRVSGKLAGSVEPSSQLELDALFEEDPLPPSREEKK
jgi:hypothetical protein